MKALLLILAIALSSLSMLGQSVVVQQSPSELRACLPAHVDAAVNNTVTLTIPAAPQGQYTYLCGLDIAISNDATGIVVSTNLNFTSTNFGGWTWKFSSPNAANSNIVQIFNWAFAVKAPLPGTAVTFVSPAANTHAAYNVNAYYYYAP